MSWCPVSIIYQATSLIRNHVIPPFHQSLDPTRQGIEGELRKGLECTSPSYRKLSFRNIMPSIGSSYCPKQ